MNCETVKWYKQKAWPFSAISPELPHGPANLRFRPKGIKSVFTLMRMATLFRIAKVETPEGIQSERQLYGMAGSNGRGLLWRNVMGGGVTAQDHLDWGGPARHGLGTSGNLPYRHWELEEASSAEGGYGGRHCSLGWCCKYTLLINKSDLITEFPPSIPPLVSSWWYYFEGCEAQSSIEGGKSVIKSSSKEPHSHPAPGFYWATYLQKRPRLLDQLAWHNWLSYCIPQHQRISRKKLPIGLSVGHE